MRRALVIGGGKPEPQFVGIGPGVFTFGIASLTRPSVQAGDLMLTVIGAAVPLASVPAGWSQLNSPPAGKLYVFGKIAGDSEPASLSWDFQGQSTGFVAAYRGVQLAPNAHVTSPVGNYTTTYTAASITPTVPSMLIYIMRAVSNGAVSGPPGMTAHAVAATDGSTTRPQLIAEEYPVPASATGTRAGTGPSTTTNGQCVAALLAFTPA